MTDRIEEITPAVVGSILQAVAIGKSDPLDLPPEHMEVHCRGIPIARLAWVGEQNDHRVVAIACTAGSHGVMDDKWKDLGKKLKDLGCKAPVRKCKLCDGREWIPSYSEYAKTISVLAGNMKIYRGIPLTPDPVYTEFVEKMSPFSIATLFK